VTRLAFAVLLLTQLIALSACGGRKPCDAPVKQLVR